MKFSKKIVLCVSLLYTVVSFGQHLDKHEWKKRVLILLTNDKENTVYKKQLAAFDNEMNHFKERKLVVYRTTPTAYAKGITTTKWNTSSKIYTNYKKTKTAAFEIILIGLDGGIKLHQTNLLHAKDLYSLIDGMPMRRVQLKKQ